MNAYRVLIVEDEPVTRMMLEARLRAAGHGVHSASSGEEALRVLGEGEFAVMVTDLYLEQMDGVDLMAHARSIDPDLELIVLTGGATTASAIAAANHHAYAYLEKPVASGKIESCVAAALSRRQQRIEQVVALRQIKAAISQIAEPQRPTYQTVPVAEPAYRVGAIEVNTQRRQVTVGGKAVSLTPGEYELLLYLAQRPDVVHSPEQLVRDLQGYSCTQDEAREPIKTQIYRLRRKIEADPGALAQLISVRGVGYMLRSGS